MLHTMVSSTMNSPERQGGHREGRPLPIQLENPLSSFPPTILGVQGDSLPSLYVGVPLPPILGLS